jgi:hypothetical protein
MCYGSALNNLLVAFNLPPLAYLGYAVNLEKPGTDLSPQEVNSAL